jgi:hypothetical protein
MSVTMVRQGRGVNKLVGGILTVVGLALLGAAWWTGSRQYTILKSWPTLEAEVTNSRVTHYLSHNTRRHTDTTMYEAEIEFRYTIDGRQFTAPSTPGYSTPSYPEMERMADTYAPGTRHTIRYNPADPKDIRFNAGYSFAFFRLSVILGGVGVVFTGAGIAHLVAFRSGQA